MHHLPRVRQVSLRGTQALNLTADRVSLESFAAFLPKQPKLTGLISLQAKIGGSSRRDAKEERRQKESHASSHDAATPTVERQRVR